MGHHSIDDELSLCCSKNHSRHFPDPENYGAKPVVTPELPFLTTCQIQQQPS
ncbi:hypothetical protein N658DRAFT_494570 [Parathielavia hyrcaniae]|uniref:Uncharacterized protein n=1 Tax=Parathielavia hyrcaniae TaxID=113614 RepID=A0AAN6Q9M5_9PEZI|nr:hypothetical protein N658DRAFT_494570 [Parathielavia hyrcaniae]